jgi:hypothetical protein
VHDQVVSTLKIARRLPQRASEHLSFVDPGHKGVLDGGRHGLATGFYECSGEPFDG